MSNKNKKTENSRLSRKDLIKNIIGKTPRKKFLSEGQEEYYKILKNNEITICTGPAGVGKSYIAMKAAVELLMEENNSYEKIIIVRPAVEAEEKLGALPGNLEEKLDPYIFPSYYLLNKIIGKESREKLKENDFIEVGDPTNPTDTDGDGIMDALESSINDQDGDGVNDEEDPANTDPCIPNLEAGNCDQDNDGLTNDEELVNGTDATNPDTDDDGFNDVLYVKGYAIASMSFVIYNRYGEVVFATTEQNIGWDGKFKNRDENPGVFTWVLDYEFSNGKSGTQKGNTTLMR